MSAPSVAAITPDAVPAAPKSLRVLWLHTQPEHYHNLMMDDLNRSSPDIEYIAAFAYSGASIYTKIPLPQVARTIILQPHPGLQDHPPGTWERYHADWHAQLDSIDFHVAFIAGYAGRTQRQLLAWCHDRGIPTVLWSDSNIRSQHGDTLRRSLYRHTKRQFLQTIIESADYLATANSRGVAYWRYYGARRDKIIRCPYYADYGRVETAKKSTRAQAFMDCGLDPARKLILTAARLAPAKSLDLAIQAFHKNGLAKQGWVYAIAGVGPLEAELKALAGPLLNQSIFFLGFRQPAQILPLMHHAELFLLPSNYEPHGIVIQEAAASGTPVIASDAVGAAHDLIEPGHNGWFFQNGSLESLQRVLETATSARVNLDAMRGNARQSFKHYFRDYSPLKIIEELSHKLLRRSGLIDPDTGGPRVDLLNKTKVRSLRIAICQPLIPHYRVPVFDLLGRQPGIRLVVLAGHSQGSLQAVNSSKYFQADLAPVDPLPLLLKNFVIQSAQWEVLKHGRFNLVIIPWDIHYLSSFIALGLARRIGLPVVLWGHGYSKNRRHLPLNIIRNWVGKRASGVILYTRTVADRLIRTAGFDPAKVFVASNALDQCSIQAARREWLDHPEALAAFQQQHGVNTQRTIIFVSRLERENRVDLLLEALAILRQSGRDTNVVLIGKGPEEPRLRTLAQQLGLQDHVIFTGAIYTDRDIAPWMLSAGVFCYPVNVGLSILHAYGFGVPMVTSDDLSRQNPEIEALIDGVNGKLYRFGNVQDMTRCCREILDDPALRQRLSAAALQQVTEHYTLPNMVQGFLDAAILVDGVQRKVCLDFDPRKSNESVVGAP